MGVWDFIVLFILFIIVANVVIWIVNIVKKAKAKSRASQEKKQSRENTVAFADQLLKACIAKSDKSWPQMVDEFSRGRATFEVDRSRFTYRAVGNNGTVQVSYSADMGATLTAVGMSMEDKMKLIAQQIAQKIPVETNVRPNVHAYESANPKANTYKTEVNYETDYRLGKEKPVYVTTKEADTVTNFAIDRYVITPKNVIKTETPEAPKLRQI